MRYDHPDLQEHLAGQYMLGTLSARCRRRVDGLAATRPALRARLSDWAERVAVLSEATAPQTPSPALWPAIAVRTQGPVATTVPPGSWARWRRAWRHPVWVGAAGLAVGVMVTTTLWRQQPQWLVTVEQVASAQQALPQSYVGILGDAQGRTQVLVSSTRHGRRLFVKVLAPLAVNGTEVLQLRALVPGEAPVLLGTLSGAKGVVELALADSAEALFKRVTTLEVVAVLGAEAQAKAAIRTTRTTRTVVSGPCAKLW